MYWQNKDSWSCYIKGRPSPVSEIHWLVFLYFVDSNNVQAHLNFLYTLIKSPQSNIIVNVAFQNNNNSVL